LAPVLGPPKKRKNDWGGSWGGGVGGAKEVRFGGGGGGGGPGSHHVRGYFYRGGYAWVCPDLPAVDIFNLVRQGATDSRRTQHTCC